MNLSDFLAVPLADLGAIDAAYAGIQAPRGALAQAHQGVTGQFLDSAETYHARYFDTGYAEWLLGTALRRVAPLPDAPVVLDIGSGSGNSVFALLKLNPRANVIATDVSPQLLAIMGQALGRTGQAGRVTRLCLDLNERWFADGTIDLAVGSAILHHLFDPAALVAEVFAAVKPGGSMIFFEPFEAGFAFLAMVFRALLAAGPARGLDPRVAAYFTAKLGEISLRRCEPKSPERFAGVDDKWLFTRPYLENVAATIGASHLDVYSIGDLDAPFSTQIRTELRLGLGLPEAALPDWAWAVIREAEGAMSRDCRSEMIIEGTIIFTK